MQQREPVPWGDALGETPAVGLWGCRRTHTSPQSQGSSLHGGQHFNQAENQFLIFQTGQPGKNNSLPLLKLTFSKISQSADLNAWLFCKNHWCRHDSCNQILLIWKMWCGNASFRGIKFPPSDIITVQILSHHFTQQVSRAGIHGSLSLCRTFHCLNM